MTFRFTTQRMTPMTLLVLYNSSSVRLSYLVVHLFISVNPYFLDHFYTELLRPLCLFSLLFVDLFNQVFPLKLDWELPTHLLFSRNPSLHLFSKTPRLLWYKFPGLRTYHTHFGPLYSRSTPFLVVLSSDLFIRRRSNIRGKVRFLYP